jgi:hypothetical protein
MGSLVKTFFSLIPNFLFIAGMLLAIGGQLVIGFSLILLSIFIWEVSSKFEDNEKDSILKKLKSALILPILLTLVILGLGIWGYSQELALDKFGMLGYLLIGPIGIYLIYKIITKIKESLKGN